MADQLVSKILIVACLALVAWAKPLDQIYKNEQYVMYSSTDTDDPSQHTIFVEGKRAMVFRVRACSSAHLLMASIYNHGMHTTDLTIGGSGNTKTVLKHHGSGKEVASADTENILHCNEMRSFWVSWAYGYFRVGWGSTLGVGIILNVEKTGDINHDVTAIGLYTEIGIAGVWEIEEHQFSNLLSIPPSGGEYPYPAMTWRTVQHAPGHFFYFTVKSCDVVSIYFATEFGAADFIMNLNQGGQNEIWKGSNKIAYNAEQTVSCTTFKTFWVSWWQNTITLGRGVIKYQNEILKAENAGVSNIYTLGFAAGANSKAMFDLSAKFDEMFAFVTKAPEDDYQHWLHISESNFVAFGVEACQSVQVVFSDSYGSISDNAIILQINWEGGSSYLKKRSGETLSSNSTQILECNSMTTIWASYANNAFRVGSSSTKGIGTFLAASTELDGRMTGIGFGSKVDAKWAIATIEPGVLRMNTDGNAGIDNYNTWATGNKKYYKEFKLDVCEGFARITLSPCLGCQSMESTGSYHIEVLKDTAKIVKRQGGVRTELKTISRSDIASCGTLLSYFVSWYEGIPVFGKGDLTSGETLLNLDEALPYSVNAISLSSDTKITWEMDMETGEQLSFQKKDKNLGYNWIKISPRLTWQRFWISGGDGEFFLSSKYGDDSNGYKFTFTNGLTTLQRNGQQIAQYSGITLDKNRRLLMVASWHDGQIRLGPETGGNVYIDYKDGNYMGVEAIGVLPYGDSAEVRMPHTFASELTFTSSANRQNVETWMELSHHDTLVFRVKSSSTAEILFAPFLYHDLVSDYYRLVIGDNSNSRVNIMRGDKIITGVNVQNILSGDEFRSFWVQWYHGEIVFGRGEHVGNDVIIAYYDPSPSPITAAGFTGFGNEVSWTVGLVPYGNLYDFEEPPSSGGGLSGGAIAGIIIGVLILVALIGGFVYLYAFGKLQYFGGSSSSSTGPSSRGPNRHEQFNNPLSYPDTNSVPGNQASSA